MAEPYSLRWFGEKIVEAVLVVLVGFLCCIAAYGLLQSYLLPDRLVKAEELMQKKFDDKIAKAQSESVQRESELYKDLEKMKQEMSSILAQLKRTPPMLPPAIPVGPIVSGAPPPIPIDKPVDPEKSRLEYLEKHLWNQQQQQQRPLNSAP